MIDLLRSRLSELTVAPGARQSINSESAFAPLGVLGTEAASETRKWKRKHVCCDRRVRGDALSNTASLREFHNPVVCNENNLVWYYSSPLCVIAIARKVDGKDSSERGKKGEVAV